MFHKIKLLVLNICLKSNQVYDYIVWNICNTIIKKLPNNHSCNYMIGIEFCWVVYKAEQMLMSIRLSERNDPSDYYTKYLRQYSSCNLNQKVLVRIPAWACFGSTVKMEKKNNLYDVIANQHNFKKSYNYNLAFIFVIVLFRVYM